MREPREFASGCPEEAPDLPTAPRLVISSVWAWLSIRYSNTNQRQGKAEATGELVIMN